MTVALSKPANSWGVRHAASLDRVEHVDPRPDYDSAVAFLRALRFCGNRDAELVECRCGVWCPTREAS